MPFYLYNCPEDGPGETFCSMSAKTMAGTGKVVCPECGEIVRTRPAKATIHGGDDRPIKCPSVGKEFKSAKALDAWAEAEGCTPMDTASAAWRSFVDRNKEAREQDARADGFTSADARRDFLKKHRRDIVAANRQAKIDKHHNEHGSDGKQTIEQAFGNLNLS